jgi:hypothetical protein
MGELGHGGECGDLGFGCLLEKRPSCVARTYTPAEDLQTRAFQVVDGRECEI